MAVSTSVTVATTATELTSVNVKYGRRGLLTMYNNGSARVYLGGSNVTTSLFMRPLDPGEFFAIPTTNPADPTPRDRWYAVVASGTSPLLITESEVN